MNILVDAMGGDNAPDAVIRGAVKAADEIDGTITLIGNEEIINKKAKEFFGKDTISEVNQKIKIHHTTEEITMDTVPQTAIDANSPVLLIGDSHTLIFSVGADMLAENAGLAETLAAKLNTPIDRIGVRGSAATAVRINLFRKAAKDPAWLKNKKYVIYCFSCREFTEAISGWAKIPVLKK